MRIQLRTTPLTMLTLVSFAAACGGVDPGASPQAITGVTVSGSPIVGPPIIGVPHTEHSFLPFDNWGVDFRPADGWETADTPILYGHVNADAKDDFVGFGYAGVWVGLSGGNHFSSYQYVLAGFGTNQGWHSDRHVRLLGDINGDGLDDIVGFGDAGVYTALSNGSGFAPARFVLADLGYNQGWRVDVHTRLLADVNHDGRKDIVAFGKPGVFIALADGSGGFGPLRFVVADFGADQGWTNARHVRTTADLNGDGLADLVAFGDAGVYTALSNGSGFSAPRFVLASFGANAGWLSSTTQRTLADVNADGRKDIIGIASDGVHVAYSSGDGGFSAASLAHGDTQLAGAVVADLNGDGYADLLVYDHDKYEWQHILGGYFGFGGRAPVLIGGSYSPLWSVADVDGNGMADLIEHDYAQTEVARSTYVAPIPPPAAPSNVYTFDVGSSSVAVAWHDNSTNETGFEVQPIEQGDPLQYFVWDETLANVNQDVVGQLDSDSDYCFRVRAVNGVGRSDWAPQACAHTASSTSGTPPQTQTLWMGEDSPPETGTPTYTVNWNPQGRVLDRFRSSYSNGDAILFLKPGHGAADCTPSNAGVIALPSNGSLSSTQIQQISWPHGDGTTDFHGCLAEVVYSQNVAPYLVFNVDFH